MLVYRVQDKGGRGPWKPGFSHRWVKSRDDHNLLHPWYVEFPNLVLPKNTNIGIGCANIIHLRRWFTLDEYKTLTKHGYKAVKIVVDYVLAESDKQLVFSRKKPLRSEVQIFKLYEK